MTKRRLPELPDTGRRYVEHTIRARLASPGIERYAGRNAGRAGRIAAGVAIAAALAAAMWLLGR